MTDRPILFSAPMVRALIDGRKTQTRRLLPNPEYYGCPTGDCPHYWQEQCNLAMVENTAADLRYAVGDRLYVREEYYQHGSWAPVEGALTKGGKQKWAFIPSDDRIQFHPQGSFRRAMDATDPGTVCLHKRLGRFMPRWASRLTLIVTDVRVERLQDCSEADAIAEGIDRIQYPEVGDWGWPQRKYAELWDSINGAGAWEANPWVVAVSFDVRKGNIDQ